MKLTFVVAVSFSRLDCIRAKGRSVGKIKSTRNRKNGPPPQFLFQKRLEMLRKY